MALSSPYFAHMGMLDPLKKIYITCKHLEHLPIVMFTTISMHVKHK